MKFLKRLLGSKKCTNCEFCTSYTGVVTLTPQKEVVYDGKAEICEKGSFTLSDTKACALHSQVRTIPKVIDGKAPNLI